MNRGHVGAVTDLAVIGSGIAGLTAAYVAQKSARVTLYETDARLGGHAHTHTVPTATGDVAVDTGFIVHNERTYPTLMRLFGELDVATQPSEMSMSVRADAAHGGAGLEWAGALGLGGLFPTWHNLARPAYVRMLGQVPRFHRQARALLAAADDGRDRTLADFLDEGGFTGYFRRHFVRPLVAAVWSCDPAVALEYPARYLFTFLQHHGMLSVFGSPQWRTVTGGSRTYVERVAAAIATAGGELRTGTKVTSVAEMADGVEITDGNGEVHRHDAVVVAVHPGQAVAMLAEPTILQRDVLTAMPFSRNLAQLHTDTSVLPRSPRARAAWNYLERPAHDGVTVTYDLTRLMHLPVASGTRYLVTLGAPDLVDPAAVIATMDYEHPVYTPESVAAQRRLPEIDSDRIAFAGAWHGWGFHEDGARSGAAAAEHLGLPWDGPPRAATGRVYRTTITHTRRGPVEHRFTLHSHTWLVDLDRLPQSRFDRVSGRFEGRDHLGDPSRSIRDNLDAFLARNGVERPAQVLMAAHPRVLGRTFNPISVFWCTDAAGSPLATVVEVHNTYGDRHAYLVHPDEHGRARVPKAMYVSPFHGVDGYYDLVVPAPDERLDIAVRLRTDDGQVFDASLRGRVVEGGRWRAAPAAAIGALLIHAHGLWLWARRLPVRPRPIHHQEGVR